MNKTILLSFLLVVSFLSCGDKYSNNPAIVLSEQRERDNIKTKEELDKEALLKSNQVLSEKEKQQIQGYISRRNWEMKYVDGIYIQEIRTGNGNKISDTNTVTFDYTLGLITGVKVYSSKKDGLKTVKLNNQDMETGLIYALKYLSKGSKARIIIPSYLGYGLYGDQKSIPKHSTLVYELEIKDVI